MDEVTAFVEEWAKAKAVIACAAAKTAYNITHTNLEKAMQNANLVENAYPSSPSGLLRGYKAASSQKAVLAGLVAELTDNPKLVMVLNLLFGGSNGVETCYIADNGDICFRIPDVSKVFLNTVMNHVDS